ncbi:MAG: MFS transporter [Deltaproteobacteria bacterium]|nr:MFS transporter [Deltaproteobacteria bacterium]
MKQHAIILSMRIKELPSYARHTFHYDLRSGMLVGVFGGFLIPFIAIVGRKIGATDFQIALLAAAPYLANAFALLWTEDIFGKGRVWYVVWPSVAGRALLLGMFYITSPGWYTALIFIYMVITAVPFPSYASIMKTNYPDECRGRLMSYVRVGIAVFWIASSAVAGWVLEKGTANYRYIFPLAAIFGVFSALQFSSIKVRGEKRRKEPFNIAARIAGPFKDRAFIRFLLAYSLFEAGLLLSLPVYPLVLVDEVKISNLATGIYGAVFSGMWLAGFFFWGNIIDRKPIRLTLAAIFGTFCLVPLIYISSRDLFVLGIAQGVSGFMTAAIELAGYIVITKISTPEDVPRYMAANIALGGLRGAVAPFIGTGLYAFAGATPVFSLSLLLGLSSVFLTWNLLKNLSFSS